jgi:hypothetical protein
MSWFRWSYKKTINRLISTGRGNVSEDSVEFEVYPCCCLVYAKYKLAPYTIKTSTTFCYPCGLCGYIRSDIHENGRTYRLRNTTDENPEIQSMTNEHASDISIRNSQNLTFTSNLRQSAWCLGYSSIE